MNVIRQGLLDLEHQFLKEHLSGNISSERMEEIRNLLQIPVGGLVKDGHHRTRQLLFGNPPQAVDIKAGSNLFHLLEHIQEEVHRFAITFHRQKRSKSQIHSELDDIRGIGPKTKQELLRSLKSVKRIRESSIEDLTAIVGKAKAKTIYDYFAETV
jgi:excinuclease ABC subunit C